MTATAVPVAVCGMLPDGFKIALDPRSRWAEHGTVLVGGAPTRLLRFTPAGRALVDRLAAGQPVPRSTGAQNLARRLLDAGLAHPRPPVTASTREVAVVIPVRNDAAGLAATLTALPGGAAVVVVDDASTDAETVSAGGKRPGTIVLRRADQGGPAAARNDGWRATGTPLVAFVDANCEPEPGWLDVVLPHFADPQVAAVAPRIVPPAGPEDGARAAYEAVASPLDLGAREANVRPDTPVPYVPTAALVVRRRALEDLDGFDERLTVGEDVDLVWRFVAAGWTVRYEPHAIVRHPIRRSWAAWLKQRFRYGTSAAPLAQRHGWAVAPAVMSPWTAGAWALVVAGHPLLGVATAGSSMAALRRQIPGPDALRLAGFGQLRGGLALARALRRAWAPATVLLAITGRRHRTAQAVVALVIAVPGLVDWFQRRPRLDPARFAALRLVDDLAYAGGVWAGCARERSGRALLPDLRATSRRRVRQTYDPVSTIGGDS